MHMEEIAIEVNFSDYTEIKSNYTKDELVDIIKRIRADVKQIRQQLMV